jgi:hypothetical protein
MIDTSIFHFKHMTCVQIYYLSWYLGLKKINNGCNFYFLRKYCVAHLFRFIMVTFLIHFGNLRKI